MSWETLYWFSQLLLVLFAGVALISGAVEGKGQMPKIGITIEVSGEGWVPADASIPLGPMPGDVEALQTFLLEAVKGNPTVEMRASGLTSKEAILVIVGPKY